MIRAYPEVASLYPNEILRLHVSTDSPQYKVQVYRQGRTLEYMSNFDESWKQGINSVEFEHYTDFGWPSHDFRIPSNWPSGVYFAMLFEGDALGNVLTTPDLNNSFSSSAQALFVIKNPDPNNSKQILYKISLTTFHAYNSTGGGSLYTGDLYMDKISKVTIHRPGGGTGGLPWDSHFLDVYDTSSPRQTFAHWDYPFIRWLEENGYAVDYCTDMDLEEDASVLYQHNLLLSVGHDEYWSTNMRNNVEEFIRNGGNVAFFSANTAWWHINFMDPILGPDGKVHFSAFSRDLHWHEFNPGNTENQLTGVSYRNGGGSWNGLREQLGYTVHNARHWIFAKSGLEEGAIFGKKENLIGYECDGAYFDPTHTPFVPDSSDGTPLDFAILGTAILHEWEDLPPRENSGNHAATMGIYCHNGIVFTGGTVDWTRVLASGNAQIQQITCNVLDNLKRCRGIKILGPLTPVLGAFIAVEGRLARFKVSTVTLQDTPNLSFKWKVYGEVTDFNSSGPSIQFGIVKAHYPITLTVEVYDGNDCIRFGTLTFVPISEAEYSTRDFFSSKIPHLKSITKSVFPNWFQDVRHYFMKHIPRVPLRVLQIGVFTGDATEWLLKNASIERIDDVDTWQGSDESAHHLLDFNEIEKFYTGRFMKESRVFKHKMTSNKFFASAKGTYNFIYIDGDHTALQTALDGLNGFRLLEPDGIMAFDDYLWTSGKEDFLNPRRGIDAVLEVCKGKYTVLDDGYQLWIKKC